MPVGFESISDTGLYQINGEVSLYHLVDYGTASLPNSHPDSTLIMYGTISYNGIRPICALHFPYTTDLHAGGILRTQKSGSTFTWTVSGCRTAIGSGFVPPSTVKYFIFDTLSTGSSSGAGLQVFGTSGELLYDSTYPLMRPVPFANANASGKKYASTSGAFLGYEESTDVLSDMSAETVWAISYNGDGTTSSGALYNTSRTVNGGVSSGGNGPGTSGILQGETYYLTSPVAVEITRYV